MIGVVIDGMTTLPAESPCPGAKHFFRCIVLFQLMEIRPDMTEKSFTGA